MDNFLGQRSGVSVLLTGNLFEYGQISQYGGSIAPIELKTYAVRSLVIFGHIGCYRAETDGEKAGRG
jgi:hypothetical protein